ncbi:MAG: lectin MOA-related protein [Methanosarcina sp.]|nr:lectin MOA-related protein [Methanosarcina sp.]
MIPRQARIEPLSSQELITAITNEFGEECARIVLDRTYITVDLAWFKTFITKYSSVDSRKYVKESFDCDSFSFVLKGEIERLEQGLAFGLLTVKTETCYHMLNFFVAQDLTVYLMEPQSDAIFRLRDTKYIPIRYEI